MSTVRLYHHQLRRGNTINSSGEILGSVVLMRLLGVISLLFN